MKKNNKKPLVSVIMPVYNAGNFLGEAIESILKQTYKNFELIIVDDASKDNSAKIISSYKKSYPRKIKAVRLKENLDKGGDPAGNIAFRLAKGEFVARMDADDVAAPKRLEMQIKYLQENPEVTVVGSSAVVIDTQGKGVGQKNVPTSYKDIYNEFFVFHPMIHPTVMVRRAAIKRKSLYKIAYKANNDYLTFFELISKGHKFANLKERLVFYRIHGANDSLMHIKKRFVNSLKIRIRAVFEFGYRPSLLSFVKLIGQGALVILLPEKAILATYLVVRGIASPSLVLPSFRLGSFAAILKKAL